MSSTLRSVRVDKDLNDWFEAQFPWRGSFPQFINEALAAFKEEYGNTPPPNEVLEQAMKKLAPRY